MDIKSEYRVTDDDLERAKRENEEINRKLNSKENENEQIDKNNNKDSR